MDKEYWSIHLDDFVSAVFDDLEGSQDGKAGHFASYAGTREEARQKIVKVLNHLVDKKMYLSDQYGTPAPDTE